MSFKMAGILAFKTVASTCRPVLLEPLDLMEITVPDAYLGDVMGDLSGRRGSILGTDGNGEHTIIRALVPQSELHLYATQLFSLTHGYGSLSRRFSGYEQVPHEAAQKIVADHARELEEAEA
jgi:elongation factor G